jgi:hypothetical protein
MEENYDDDQHIKDSLERIYENYGETFRRLSLSEWQDSVQKKYPYLRFNVAECECERGWANLLDPLFKYVNRWNAEEVNGEHENPIFIEQVKAKFGTLRFYYSGGDEYFGGMVDYAEALSAKTCELCGNVGENQGHNMTRCRTCTNHTKYQ